MNPLQRFYSSRPILVLFFIFVFIPILILLSYGYSFVSKSQPQPVGTQNIQGLSSQVNIVRDELGVTFISGQDDNDVFFAMGYVHAQDRLWQLELQRRQTQGRLAEVFGRSAVGFDIFARALGLNRNAKQSWQQLSPQAQRSLQAYADGINGYLKTNPLLPVEFTSLGITPQPWHPTDSIAWIKMFGLSLSGNFQKDMNRLIINQSLSAQKAQALSGVNQPHEVHTVAKSDRKLDQQLIAKFSLLGEFSEQLKHQWGIGEENIGSNAWVVAGKHTQSGLATLYSDPHLDLTLPSRWYAVNLKGNKLNVAGMSMVGLPVVMLGRNQHIAWAATNMMADTMDLYYEQINDENSQLYKRAQQWLEFETYVESIDVKADFPSFLRQPLAPLKVTIRHTDYGPLISDLVRGSNRPISLRWFGGSKKDTSYNAFFDLNYATNWDEFKQAMAQHVAPTMNLFYIDNQQNIGYLGIGNIPVRGKGIGHLPVPGWDLDYRWRGIIPKDQMPQSYNPEQGYLLSANNKVADDDYPYFISVDWAQPQRAERIEQLLTAKINKGEKISHQYQQTMQLDMLDLEAKAMIKSLIDVETDIPHLQEMLEFVGNWDGSTKADSVAATIFFTWTRHLRQYVFADEFKRNFIKPALSARYGSIVSQTTLSQLHNALTDNNLNWCDITTTADEVESCEKIKIEALIDSHYELSKLLGSDISDWRWDEVHTLVYKHQPFSEINGLDMIFERRVGKGGSSNSINMAGSNYFADEGYIQDVGPAFRQNMQFSDDQYRHLFVNSTGQSGNFISDHYDDMVMPFINGQLYPLNKQAPSNGKVLTLKPNNSNK